MSKNDYQGTLDLVVAGVALAMESMNLKRPMTAEQINDLAEEIVDTANEDNLGLEDLMLFMQGLTRGKYGELYESMDIPKFMEKFELYRQDRHTERLRIRENEHLQYKSMGPTERTNEPDPLSEHFSKFASTLSTLRQNVKDLRNQR